MYALPCVVPSITPPPTEIPQGKKIPRGDGGSSKGLRRGEGIGNLVKAADGVDEILGILAEDFALVCDGEAGVDDPAELLAGVAHGEVGAVEDFVGAAAGDEVIDDAVGDGGEGDFGSEVGEFLCAFDGAVGGVVIAAAVGDDPGDVGVFGAEVVEFGEVPAGHVDEGVEVAFVAEVPPGFEGGVVVGDVEVGVGFESEEAFVGEGLFEFLRVVSGESVRGSKLASPQQVGGMASRAALVVALPSSEWMPTVPFQDMKPMALTPMRLASLRTPLGPPSIMG